MRTSRPPRLGRDAQHLHLVSYDTARALEIAATHPAISLVPSDCYAELLVDPAAAPKDDAGERAIVFHFPSRFSGIAATGTDRM